MLQEVRAEGLGVKGDIGDCKGKRQSDRMNGNAGSAGSVTVERGREDAGFIVGQSGEASVIDFAGRG